MYFPVRLCLVKRAHAARVFVHEFAHLRYGVFDEYQEVNTGGTVPKCPARQHEGSEISKASIMARTDEDEVRIARNVGRLKNENVK